MAHLPEVVTLYAIADNIHSGRRPSTNTPHDASALLRLVMYESLAVRNPHSVKITEFVGCYRLLQDQADNLMYDQRRVLSAIRHFMVLLDNLFFFDTLTRQVDGPNGRGNLVTLEISEDPSSTDYGDYRPLYRIIKLNRGKYRSEDGRYVRHRIESVLFTLAHEMTHAFLQTFSDKSHPGHHEWVDANNGHGRIFWELLEFIAGIVSQITESLAWQQERCILYSGPSESRPEWPGLGRPEYPPEACSACCHFHPPPFSSSGFSQP